MGTRLQRKNGRGSFHELRCRLRGLYGRQRAPASETTLAQKRYCIEGMLKPYFGDLLVGDIDARAVIAWENELLECRTPKGKR
nr:hypothetical protein [Parvibacter caecicola]